MNSHDYLHVLKFYLFHDKSYIGELIGKLFLVPSIHSPSVYLLLSIWRNKKAEDPWPKQQNVLPCEINKGRA